MNALDERTLILFLFFVFPLPSELERQAGRKSGRQRQRRPWVFLDWKKKIRDLTSPLYLFVGCLHRTIYILLWFFALEVVFFTNNFLRVLWTSFRTKGRRSRWDERLAAVASEKAFHFYTIFLQNPCSHDTIWSSAELFVRFCLVFLLSECSWIFPPVPFKVLPNPRLLLQG